MVKRLSDMPEVEAHHLRRIECPTFDDTPALPGKPLSLNFYMGGYGRYKDILQDVRSKDYDTFSFQN